MARRNSLRNMHAMPIAHGSWLCVRLSRARTPPNRTQPNARSSTPEFASLWNPELRKTLSNPSNSNKFHKRIPNLFSQSVTERTGEYLLTHGGATHNVNVRRAARIARATRPLCRTARALFAPRPQFLAPVRALQDTWGPGAHRKPATCRRDVFAERAARL